MTRECGGGVLAVAGGTSPGSWGLPTLGAIAATPPRQCRGPAALRRRRAGMLDVELFLERPARLKQPIGTVLSDRASLALALPFQRRGGPRAPTPGGRQGA